jgi:hypothetical protein
MRALARRVIAGYAERVLNEKGTDDPDRLETGPNRVLGEPE